MNHLRVRDFFEGYSVRVVPTHGRWVVQLVRADGEIDESHTYVSFSGAVEGVEEWMRTLVDETPVPERTGDDDRRELQDLMTEVAARRQSGELTDGSEDIVELIERDQVLEWLERQMASEPR